MKLVESSKRFPDEEACEKYLYEERRVARDVVFAANVAALINTGTRAVSAGVVQSADM